MITKRMQMLDRLLQDFSPELLNAIYSDGAQQAKARAQRGAYYTPVAVAAQMTLDALTALMMRRLQYTEAQVQQVLSGQGPTLLVGPCLQLLSQLKWLDMASGTGIFALVHLALLKQLGHAYGMGDQLAHQAAFGMHVNDSHLEALETFKQHCPYAVKITGCDALTALRHETSIARVLQSGGFDLIIGNPPYVGERGNKALFQGYRSHPDLSPYYVARMDLYYFFLHLGLDWLKPEGCLAQITTHYYATADGAHKLRAHLKAALEFAFVRFDKACEAFADVKGLSFLSVVGIKKDPQASERLTPVLIDALVGPGKRQVLSQEALFDSHGQLILERPPIAQALEHLSSATGQCLGDLAEVNQGVVTGMDRWRQQQVSEPVFVFTEGELPRLKDRTRFKPFIKNSMVKPYRLVATPKLWLLYTDGMAPENHPELIEGLLPYKARLEERREVKNGVRAWYELQWGRAPIIFERPKLVSPQRATRCSFALVEAPCYGSADIYYIGGRQLEVPRLKALAAYLNSPIVYGWLYQFGKRKGHLLELYATPLKRVPVPNFSEAQWAILADYYDRLAAIAAGSGDLTREEQPLHDWLCSVLGLPASLAEALWDWYIVSVQT